MNISMMHTWAIELTLFWLSPLCFPWWDTFAVWALWSGFACSFVSWIALLFIEAVVGSEDQSNAANITFSSTGYRSEVVSAYFALHFGVVVALLVAPISTVWGSYSTMVLVLVYVFLFVVTLQAFGMCISAAKGRTLLLFRRHTLLLVVTVAGIGGMPCSPGVWLMVPILLLVTLMGFHLILPSWHVTASVLTFISMLILGMWGVAGTRASSLQTWQYWTLVITVLVCLAIQLTWIGVDLANSANGNKMISSSFPFHASEREDKGPNSAVSNGMGGDSRPASYSGFVPTAPSMAMMNLSFNNNTLETGMDGGNSSVRNLGRLFNSTRNELNGYNSDSSIAYTQIPGAPRAAEGDGLIHNMFSLDLARLRARHATEREKKM